MIVPSERLQPFGKTSARERRLKTVGSIFGVTAPAVSEPLCTPLPHTHTPRSIDFLKIQPPPVPHGPVPDITLCRRLRRSCLLKPRAGERVRVRVNAYAYGRTNE